MQFNKISLQFLTDDYQTVAYSLPIPTYRRSVTKSNQQGYLVITYELKHVVTSLNQFKWLANIKQSMQQYIKVEFEFIEYMESSSQENSNIKYSFKELQEHFKSINTIYPKIYLPTNKKEIYQRLCIYAKALYYNKIFYIEMLMFAAIRMNNLLGKPLNYKEILNKSKRAYSLVEKTKDEVKQKLTQSELKTALKSGGTKRGEQKKMEQKKNQEQIFKLINSGEYFKPNGKPNITVIANQLNLKRETVSRIYSKSLLCVLSFFFFSYLYLNSYVMKEIGIGSVYHNAIAKVTLFQEKRYIGAYRV